MWSKRIPRPQVSASGDTYHVFRFGLLLEIHSQVDAHTSRFRKVLQQPTSAWVSVTSWSECVRSGLGKSSCSGAFGNEWVDHWAGMTHVVTWYRPSFATMTKSMVAAAAASSSSRGNLGLNHLGQMPAPWLASLTIRLVHGIVDGAGIWYLVSVACLEQSIQLSDRVDVTLDSCIINGFWLHLRSRWWA